jgi:ABC-2 type transport system permease protein
MSPRLVALRAGLQRGAIEIRQTVSSGADLWSVLFFPFITLVVMFFLRHKSVPGTGFSLSSQSIPGILGMSVILNGMMMMGVTLAMDRDDGTLLRVKATPNGMIGYLVGRFLGRAGAAVIGILIPLIPAIFIFQGLDLVRLSAWVTMAWVLGIGLLAVLPFGAIIGSLFKNAQNVGFLTLPMMALVGVSGVFYPIDSLPQWLQWTAQAFPIYWLGLGLRSAMLPGELAAAEIGDSWRHAETFMVLGLWAVAGCLLAPWVLRRMARRQAGSSVKEREQVSSSMS